MRPRDIATHLKKEPFRPIRLFLTDGSHYDVRHPEMLMVSPTEMVIGLQPGEDKVVSEFAYCDPIHVVRIEPINGARAPRKKKRGKR